MKKLPLKDTVSDSPLPPPRPQRLSTPPAGSVEKPAALVGKGSSTPPPKKRRSNPFTSLPLFLRILIPFAAVAAVLLAALWIFTPTDSEVPEVEVTNVPLPSPSESPTDEGATNEEVQELQATATEIVSVVSQQIVAAGTGVQVAPLGDPVPIEGGSQQSAAITGIPADLDSTVVLDAISNILIEREYGWRVVQLSGDAGNLLYNVYPVAEGSESTVSIELTLPRGVEGVDGEVKVLTFDGGGE